VNYRKPHLFWCILGSLWIILSACSLSENSSPVSPTSAAAQAGSLATQQPAASPTGIPATITPQVIRTNTQSVVKPTSTLTCVNNLEYISDLTVPDGSLIARGAEIDKRWQVKNSGTCNWDSGYRLVLIAGSELGMPKEQALFPARAGREAVIRMLLKAPFEPGIYTSAWQAVSPSDVPFGEVIYIDIQVN